MNKVSILKNHKDLLNQLWKLLVLSLIFWFIASQLSGNNWVEFQSVSLDLTIIVFVLILMGLNWGLEAKKWQILVGTLSFFESVKAVLIGLLFKQFISAFGDWSGRVSASGNKAKGSQVGSFVINSICQTLMTFTFGLIGTITLIRNQQLVDISNIYFIVILSSTLAVLSISVIIWFRKSLIKKLSHWFNVAKDVSAIIIIKILCLSALRYFVFFFQFFLIFKMLEPSIDSWVLLNGIAFIFLAKSIIPTLNLFGDIGIREFSALLFFGQFGVDPTSVISATLLLWLINVFLPSTSAIVFVPKLKLIHN